MSIIQAQPGFVVLKPFDINDVKSKKFFFLNEEANIAKQEPPTVSKVIIPTSVSNRANVGLGVGVIASVKKENFFTLSRTDVFEKQEDITRSLEEGYRVLYLTSSANECVIEEQRYIIVPANCIVGILRDEEWARLIREDLERMSKSFLRESEIDKNNNNKEEETPTT